MVTDHNKLIDIVLGVEGKPPAPDQLQSVRTKALAKLQELGSGAIGGDDRGENW